MGNFFSSLFSSGKQDNAPEAEEKNDQKNFDILKYDGIRAMRIGKVAYALKCFSEASRIKEDFEMMNYMVSAHTMSNDLESAKKVLDRMVELKPDDVPTRLSRVNLLFMMDMDAEVLDDCAHVIEVDSSNHAAYFLMAKSKRATNNPLGAIADLTKALALKDDFEEAYLCRAEILLLMGQPKEALPDVQKAVEVAPEEETAYLLRGRVMVALGRMDEAASDFRQVMDLNPFNEEASVLYGQLLIEQGKYDEAIAFFDDVVDMAPSLAKAYSERGRAKNLKGDKAGAFEDLKKSLELNPQGEEARLMNGRHSNFDNLYKGGIF